MNTRYRKLPLWTLAFALAAAAPELRALEPPRPGELAALAAEGRLAGLRQRAELYGNHRVKPWLAARTLRMLRGGGPELMTPLPAWRGMPTTGTNKVLVFLIDFPDAPALETAAAVTNQIFGAGTPANYPLESLRPFYARSSFGRLDLQGSVLGWYRMAHERSWYTNSYGDGNLANARIIQEVANAFDPAIDYSQFDNNGDGQIDYFAVIWAGAHGDWASFWWGYQWSLDSLDVRCDGVQFYSFSWQWESYDYPSGTFEPSTIIHETGHALGLPDYYDYDATVGPDGGVGGLDMMDGNYCDHNGFSKFMLDWLTPVAVTSSRTGLVLRATANAPDALTFGLSYTGGTAYAEYFLAENRHPAGNDAIVPGSGLLIWHVDAQPNEAGTDFLYDNSYTSHKLLRLMEADGLEQIEQNGYADAGDFYAAPATFTPYSFPVSQTYSGASTHLFAVNLSAPATNMTLDLLVNPDVFGWTTNAAATAENSGSVTVSAVRLAGTNAASIGYATADVTATGGLDYAVTTGRFTFASGTTLQAVSVPIINDAAEEPDEQFRVLLRSPPFNTVFASDTLAVTILSDPADDVTPPALRQVLVLASNDVRITLSELVTTGSVQALSNYSLAGGVLAAGRSASGRVVGLALAAAPASAPLTVSGLRDLNNNAMLSVTTNIAFPDPALALWLRMDEGAGAATADSSGHGRSGTLVNGPAWTAGQTGYGLSFDEADDQLTVADFTYGPQFTASFWFRCTDNSGTAFQYVLSHGSVQAANNLNVYIGESGHSLLAGVVRTSVLDADDPTDDATLGSLDAALPGFPDGLWHLYTLTVKGGEGAKVYLDGVLRASNPALGGSAINPSGSLYLGSRSYSFTDRYFGGILDDMRLYQRALDPDEVAVLFNAGPSVAITKPSPSGAWLQGENVPLAGSGSDPEGASLRFVWRDGTNAVLGEGASVTGRFSAAGTRPLTLLGCDAWAAWARTNLPVTVLADVTTNGLPDAWEAVYWPAGNSGGGTNDSDRDGQSNFSEWVAGTNPTNAASLLAWTQVTAVSNEVRVGWNAVSGKTYSILTATNLPSAFTASSTVKATAEGALCLTNPVSGTTLFYRLQVER